MRVQVSIVALLLVAFSGCVGSDGTDSPPPTGLLVRDPAEVWPLLSPAALTGLVKEHVPSASFDGKRMDAWVYRPNTEERVPVIINFSPYWGNLAAPAGERGDHFSEYLIDYFVPRGYAVVLTSVRGTGESEGCFNLGGDIEKRDAAAVIDHFAGQPWSNGNVAAGGKSYDGTTPQGVATLHPEALKAIIPVSAISELYKYNYKGGLSYNLHGANFNARYVALVGWGVSPGSTDIPEELSPDDACADFPIIAGEGVGSAATGDYTAYWQERDYTKDAADSQAALLFIHGLQDWNVKPDHILPWLEAYAGPKKVWLHQWADDDNGGHVYPFRDDWNYTMLRFLDHTLKGVDTGLFEEPAVQVEDSLNRWRHETDWPPEEANETQLYLSSDSGKGKLGNPGDGETRSFVDNGEASGPTASENQLVYESEPLASPMHLVGVPIVQLTVSSDKAAGKLGVSLYEIGEGEPELINWGGLNLRHRNDVRQPQDVTPNTEYTVEVELFPQDTVVAAGHRLALVVAGNAGSNEFDPVPTNARITVTEDSNAIFRFLERPASSVRLEEPQPVETYCWAC